MYTPRSLNPSPAFAKALDRQTNWLASPVSHLTKQDRESVFARLALDERSESRREGHFPLLSEACPPVAFLSAIALAMVEAEAGALGEVSFRGSRIK